MSPGDWIQDSEDKNLFMVITRSTGDYCLVDIIDNYPRINKYINKPKRILKREQLTELNYGGLFSYILNY